MGYLCDFCGEQRSMVYCRSDSASLCLSCDRNVHSANALSKRHLRTLVCERCNSQPALVRCAYEKISLCRDCDRTGHAGPSHKGQPIHCYTGCPLASELSEMWSFLLDDTENGACRLTDRIELFSGASTGSGMQQVSFSTAKGAVEYDDDFYDDFIKDEVDLNIENYEELFGVSHDNSDQLFGNDDNDGIFGTKDMPRSHGPYAAEGSILGEFNTMQPACSNTKSAGSIISSKTEPNVCFTREAYSSLSLSEITWESSGGDHQDSGVSLSPMAWELPRCPPSAGPECSMPSSSRSDAVLRYKEKKKARQFEKKVRYESRKARADVRRRVKGRFVKAGDAYDYDPFIPTRSWY